jgi:hypothetical protein
MAAALMFCFSETAITQPFCFGLQWARYPITLGATMEPIKVIFTPTKDDHFVLARTVILRSFTGPRLIFWGLLVGGAIILTGALLIQEMQNPSSNPSIIYVAVAILTLTVAFLFGIFYFLLPSMAANQFETRPDLHVKHRWEMSDEQVEIDSTLTQIKTRWESFRDLIDAKDYYLVRPKDDPNILFIPKRAFESPAHEAAFRAMVEAHLGAIKK